MKKRGFEVISTYAKKGINLPKRKTACSAGYDIEIAEDVVLFPHTVTLVPTGLKVYMEENEYLGIHVRSSIAIKKMISCINAQGVIDADYYDNPDNEGHILIPLINHSEEAVSFSKGTRIAQGIFYRYLLVDGDNAGLGVRREGGMGSTGEG